MLTVVVDLFTNPTRIVRGMAQAADSVAKFGRRVNVVAAIAAKSIAAFGSVSIIGGLAMLTAALAQLTATATGAFGVIPGLIASTVVAISTFKLATLGLGDAIEKALLGTAEQFADELKKLPPAAREVALAVSQLRPRFDSLRATLSKRMFAGFAAEIRALSNVYFIELAKSMYGVAGSVNESALALAKFARSQRAIKQTSEILAYVRQSAEGTGKATAALGRSMLAVTRASASFLPQVTASLGGALERYAADAERRVDTGQMRAEIERGIAALKTLGDILGSVGSIIKSIFIDSHEAVKDLGAGLKDTLGAFADWLNTAEGMQAVGSVWAVLGVVAKAFVDSLKQLGPLIAQMFANIAPAIPGLVGGISMFLVAIGKALPVVGKVLALIGDELGKAFIAASGPVTELITTIANLVGAITPVLSPIVKFAAILVRELAVGVRGAEGPLRELAVALGGALVEAGVALRPVIGEIIRLLPALVRDLVPALIELTRLLSRLLVALAPILVDIVKLLKPLVAAIGWVADALGGLFGAVDGGDQAMTQLAATLFFTAVAFKAYRAWVILSTAATTLFALIKREARVAVVLFRVAVALVAAIPYAARLALWTIATKAWTAATWLASVATRAWAAAQVAWNAVMSAGRLVAFVAAVRIHAAAVWLSAAATRAWAIVQAGWNAVMAVGRLVAFVAAVRAYAVASALASGVTKAWTLIQVAWNAVMSAGRLMALVTAIKVFAVTSVLASGVTKIWTGIQAAFNFVMAMNPVGLVIIAIVALVAAIVLAYKNSETFRRVVHESWEGIKIAAKAVWDAIVAWFTFGVNFYKGVWEKISAVGEWFISTILGLRARFVNAAKQLMQGLVDGIRAGYEWVKQQIRAVATAIPNWLKSILGIRSPSTVMAGLGQQIISGLAGGIRSQMPVLSKAMDVAAQAVTSLDTDTTVTLNAEPGAGIAAGGLAGGAAVINLTINAPATADPAEVGRQVITAIRAAERRAGRRVLLPA